MGWSIASKRMGFLAFGMRFLASGLGVVMVLAAASSASARTETFRWYHDSPGEVTGYRMHWGTSSRQYDHVVELGKPAADSLGVYSYDLTVPDTATVYVSVTAYDAAGDSVYSNEKVRQGQATAPPPPLSSGSDANSAILGFKLWNAADDVVIDSNFVSGEQIDLGATGNCIAIEVIGNDYLSPHGSPGSVMFALDEADPSSCSIAGTTHENNPPYAWETDEGPGQFLCADSLTEPGTHTLRVTPFDGNDCSGTKGAAETLVFEVLAPGSTAPQPSEPLGQPGRPVVID